LTKSLEVRFWDKVDRRGADECWLWTGAKNASGHGRIGPGGRGRSMVLAHRVSYELAFGSIPQGDGYHGRCVCHTCDNGWCVNPAHLFRGHHQDNMDDKKAKGRTSRLKGVQNPRVKLTQAQVEAVRSDPCSREEIAAKYGISASHIWRIKTRSAWSHI
jgi:hypothetical protein